MCDHQKQETVDPYQLFNEQSRCHTAADPPFRNHTEEFCTAVYMANNAIIDTADQGFC